MGVQNLQYEPSIDARPVIVEEDAGITRVTVMMQGLYAPIPRWVNKLHGLSLVVAPIYWLAVLVTRFILRKPNPARAIFEVTTQHLIITFRDPTYGEIQTITWPRDAIAEARANRYESGFWINVPGHLKETYLRDVPRATIERLDEELNQALANEIPPAPIAAADP